ncbi:hypothetical protein CPT_Sycamore_058 [Streptomyces phage Sycamore]|uniref:Uncharacterized protein n=1 Tax=Streptomyces phage Sycamore TaxID=2767589 RepID=A0A873WHJ4_9CAUD|nr:hypothetical protein CPT_Sycamore_058 [Streptomyces phage Sycamore]
MEPRLLPWSGPNGKQAFLCTDDPDGLLSRLADNMEASQLRTGSEVVDTARQVLAERHEDPIAVRFIARRLLASLSDVLRVCESRGARLGIAPDQDPEAADEGPEEPQ